jgi:hypothetical protein
LKANQIKMKTKQLITSFILFSALSFYAIEPVKNEILIKYSLSQKNFLLLAVNPHTNINRKSNTVTAFCNNSNNMLDIEIYSRLGFLKIMEIKTNKNSYIEINYDNRTNTLFLGSMLGEFDIISLNSHINSITAINDVEITNYASSYRIISYPGTNIFIKVIEGKLNVKKDKESTLLITDETCEISDKHVKLSDINDLETSLIILNNRLFSEYGSIIENNLQSIDKFSSNKNNNQKSLDKIKYLSLENIFSKTIMNDIGFGNELDESILENPNFWKGILKTYPINH